MTYVYVALEVIGIQVLVLSLILVAARKAMRQMMGGFRLDGRKVDPLSKQNVSGVSAG